MTHVKQQRVHRELEELLDDLRDQITRAQGYGTPHEHYLKMGMRTAITDLRAWLQLNTERGNVDAANLSSYLLAMWIIADGYAS